MAKTTLGELETLVLLAVARRPDDAYAVTVREEIQQRAGREMTRGTVYVTLDRLLRKGFLESSMGDPTPQRGGKARKYFRVTGAGRTVLGESLGALRQMADGVDLAGETQ
jgi:DNA-binding PadR family transcriptional regulator